MYLFDKLSDFQMVSLKVNYGEIQIAWIGDKYKNECFEKVVHQNKFILSDMTNTYIVAL